MDMRLTRPAVRLLQAFLEDPGEPHFGLELMRKAGVSSGSLYPWLRRLEQAGWIEGEREDIDPKEAGRPARRYYTMTGQGIREAHLAMAELRESLRLPPSPPRWDAGPTAR